jgi:hypothetical protein
MHFRLELLDFLSHFAEAVINSFETQVQGRCAVDHALQKGFTSRFAEQQVETLRNKGNAKSYLNPDA